MKSSAEKKKFYTYLRKVKANSSAMKAAWKNIIGACKGDLPFFLSCKGIMDAKAGFVRGIAAKNGSPRKATSKKKGEIESKKTY